MACLPNPPNASRMKGLNELPGPSCLTAAAYFFSLIPSMWSTLPLNLRPRRVLTSVRVVGLTTETSMKRLSPPGSSNLTSSSSLFDPLLSTGGMLTALSPTLYAVADVLHRAYCTRISAIALCRANIDRLLSISHDNRCAAPVRPVKGVAFLQSHRAGSPGTGRSPIRSIQNTLYSSSWSCQSG